MELKNKNLILAPSNKESYIKEWAKNKKRNFDIWLSYYNNDYEKTGKNIILPLLKDNDKVFVEKGFKYPTAYNIITNNYKDFFEYDYVWMPDDDIDLCTEEISKLFNIVKEYDLWLAMPSIDSNSYITFKNQLHQNGNILRYVGFIEVQCPLFSKYALYRCWNTFNESKSGWGIDLVWPKLLNRPLNKIAVIDDIIARHTRPVGKGELYKKLDVDPDAEMQAMKKKYDVKIDLNTYGIIKK